MERENIAGLARLPGASQYLTLTVWESFLQSDLGIQHRFTRMFPDLLRLPYLRRLQHLKLWTLEVRRVRADLIEVYKIIYRIS